MYQALDLFFLLFHSILIVFNLFGWIWRLTRRMHLWCIISTILSWFGLGLFYGWGYCPCTDWHWQVKQALGETGLPASYIKYYLDYFFGFAWNSVLVDVMVVCFGLSAFGTSLWLNWRDRRLSGKKNRFYL
jgi:hypothetical protein